MGIILEEEEQAIAEDLMICFGEMGRHSLSKIKTDHLRQGERAVLFCIYRSPNGKMKANEIALNLNVAAPSITTVLNRLEERGYLLRTAAQDDRRVVIVSLTEAGRETLEGCIRQMNEHFKQLVQHLGAEDAKELLRLINKTLTYYKTK